MPDALPLPLGTVLGTKYRLEGVLGKGGMGVVYLAENVDIGRRVAVKVLLPEVAADSGALQRFRTEARAATAIGHPNIAEVIDFGTTPEGGAFLVLEYLEGETLGARIHRAGPLDVATVGWVGGEILVAVAAAHAKGIIHRDLKPDNVFLVDQPLRAVKLLDFGVSRFRRPGEATLTRTGTVMGTPAYMAPEQARGSKDVGPSSDLYSVGAILYEALTGAPAFGGDSYTEVLARVMTEPPCPLASLRPGLPGALVELVDGLLSKTPAGRPADALGARVLLAEATRETGGGAHAEAPTIRSGEALVPAPTPRAVSAQGPRAPSTPAPAALVQPQPQPPTLSAEQAPARKRGPVTWLIALLAAALALGTCATGVKCAGEYRKLKQQSQKRSHPRRPGALPPGTEDAADDESAEPLPEAPGAVPGR